MSFFYPWGKIMLYSAVCLQVDLTPEKSSLASYVLAIAEQTGRARDPRRGFRPNPAKSVPGGSLLLEKQPPLRSCRDDSVSKGPQCQAITQETLCLQLFCSFRDLNWECLTTQNKCWEVFCSVLVNSILWSLLGQKCLQQFLFVT